MSAPLSAYALWWQIKPVTLSRISTALARGCLICQNAVRSQENPDIILEKGPLTSSLQWPWHCCGATMTFYRVPTKFLLELGSHDTFIALTMCALRFHCVCFVLMGCCRKEHHKFLGKCDGRPWCWHNPCVRPRSSYCKRPYCAAMAPYGDPTVLLLERRAKAFVLSYSKYVPSFGVLCNPKACTVNVAVETIVIVLRAPRLSAFFFDAIGLP